MKMRRRSICVIVLSFSLLFWLLSQFLDEKSASISASEVLKPFLSCTFGEELQVVRVDERVCAEPFRHIKINNQEFEISVVEGFRVMLAFAGRDYYFANLKIERSEAEKYLDDKRMLIQQINSNGLAGYFQKIGDFDVYVEEKEELDSGGSIGVYTLFSDTKKVILTAYILNQGEEQRVFESMDEYRDIRDLFLERLCSCSGS